MIEIGIMMCEKACEATFGRLNITGLILPGPLIVRSIPYTLHSIIVITAKDLALGQEIGLTIGPNKEIIVSSNTPFAKAFCLNCPAQVLVLSKNLDITARIGAFSRTESWQIEIGETPNARNEISDSGIICDSSPWDEITRIARKELMIVDGYVDPASYVKLFSSISPSINVKILTSPKRKDHWEKWLANPRTSPRKLLVKYSSKFHDRFIIRDEEACFAFGHSLKDLDRGRISYFTRLSNKEEYSNVMNMIRQEWSL